jgi:hypothetical protein
MCDGEMRVSGIAENHDASRDRSLDREERRDSCCSYKIKIALTDEGQARLLTSSSRPPEAALCRSDVSRDRSFNS